jgi:hypothetical protein
MMRFRGYRRLLAGVAVVALLGCAMLWGIPWLQQPRYEGRTMTEWLKKLATEPGRSGSPLDIIRVHVDTGLHTSVEVPLSYDLVRECNFLDGYGKILIIIDHDIEAVHQLGETNGNCLFPLPWWGVTPGVHEVTVKFVLWTGVDQAVSARGSSRTIAFDNNPTSR